MLTRYEYKNLTWIDLESPTREDVERVREEYKLNPIVSQELARPSLRAKVESYEGYIYMILHFPVLKHSHATEPNQEVDFILGKDFIITAHYDTIDTLHKFSKIFEVNSILDKTKLGEHAGFIFYFMMREMYTSLANELEFVFDSLKSIETRIFRGKEKEMVFALSNVSRVLLDFRQSTIHHKDMLQSFDEASQKLYSTSYGPYAKYIRDEYYKVTNTIHSHTELLTELRETNNSLLNTKQNETIKTLTMMAFMTFPLTLFAQIFSINAKHNPFIGLPYDFWIMIGVMVAATIGMFAYFKYKKWL